MEPKTPEQLVSEYIELQAKAKAAYEVAKAAVTAQIRQAIAQGNKEAGQTAVAEMQKVDAGSAVYWGRIVAKIGTNQPVKLPGRPKKQPIAA
ncbi:MAG TPA: hypothetical protein VD999_06175 [Vitreimonas sp.]|nr:hypothetical protein [Vitreimonas sp.]